MGVTPVVAGAAATIRDGFVLVMTIGETMATTFDGVNADAAHRRTPNAGSVVAVPLFQSSGSLFAENVYHPVGINGGILATDLISALVQAVTTIPRANIDFRILHDVGALDINGLPGCIKASGSKPRVAMSRPET